MIAFKHKFIDQSLELGEGSHYSLIIENPSFLYSFVNDLITSNEENFALSENSKVLPFAKNALVITDVFSLDLNNKKMLTQFYKALSLEYQDVKSNEELQLIDTSIVSLVEKIRKDLDVKTDFNDVIKLEDIFSLMNLRIEVNDSSLLELLVTFIKVYKRIIDIKAVFVLNILDYLSEKEINQLITELNLNHISLINIGSKDNYAGSNLKKVLVDRDLCEI